MVGESDCATGAGGFDGFPQAADGAQSEGWVRRTLRGVRIGRDGLHHRCWPVHGPVSTSSAVYARRNYSFDPPLLRPRTAIAKSSPDRALAHPTLSWSFALGPFRPLGPRTRVSATCRGTSSMSGNAMSGTTKANVATPTSSAGIRRSSWPSMVSKPFPVTVLVGDQDPATPLAMAEDIHRRFANFTIRIIPSSSHPVPWNIGRYRVCDP
jgi:pimeloyl-ACP methyl ester carboxylesterase